ncbi:hypothetical protein NQ318_012049 [Aromia moschata]|uniref:C2H2-type domain-containing protein n=1 Tax=Aromia moschata TaxID=1265417 RepID=A0AAV8XL79_9CUCU|nr:hypothetical protein NQ318_012049 [Aromia moschata]
MECHKSEPCLGIESEKLYIKMEHDTFDWDGSNSGSQIHSSATHADDADIKPLVYEHCVLETNRMPIEYSPYQDPRSVQEQHESTMVCQDSEASLDIKLEQFGIKTEEDESDRSGNNSLSPNHSGDSLCDDTEIKPFEYCDLSTDVATTVKSELYQDTSEIKPEDPEGHKSTEDVEATVYQCKFCCYKAKVKRNLTRHMLVHRDASEVPTFECELCSYKANVKRNLNRHMLIHKDASEGPIYECKFCSYKAKVKRNLANHTLIHQAASKAAAFRCKVCPYKTKLKTYLTRHMQIHKDASSITIYECKICPFKTKWKHSLKKHVRTHQDATEVAAHQ